MISTLPRQLFVFFFLCIITTQGINAQNRIIVNPSFETGSLVPFTSVIFANSQRSPNPTINGWYTNHPPADGVDSPIEWWRGGANPDNNTPAQDGNYFVELNAYQAARLYQIVYLVNGEKIGWQYYHRQRSGSGTQTIQFSIYNEAGTSKLFTIDTNTASSTSSWDNRSGSYTFTGTTGIYQIGFEATTSGGSGNFLDNITIGLTGLSDFPAATATATEGAAFNPTVYVNGSVTSPSTITFTVTGGTAVEGIDYNFPDKTLDVPVGPYALANALPIGFSLIDNAISRGTRTVEITLSGVSGSLTAGDANGDGYKQTFTITINDNDPNPFGVTTVPNLWLKADAGITQSGGSVSRWANQGSMSNADATQATATKQPALVTSGVNQINFNPILSFDGTDDAMATPTLSGLLGGTTGNETATQFIVYRHVGSDWDNIYNVSDLTGPWKLGFNNVGQMLQQNLKSDPTSLVKGGQVALVDMAATTISAGGSTLSLNINGNSGQVQGGDYKSIPDGPLNLATYNGRFLQANIAELIVYPSILLAEDRKKVQSHLAVKYGISLGNNTSTPIYYNSAGTSIYANGTYKYDVFGIGKDDGSGLNQRSSNSANTGSGDGTGQSGKGNVVLSNASSLDNNDYLLIGHDNGALTEQTNDLPTSLAGVKRIGREWKVKRTNDPGNVTVKFSTLGLALSGISAADFKLLIDADGNGDFTNGTVTEVAATSFANNEVTFAAVNLPHNAVFTFMTQLPQVGPGVKGATVWYKPGSTVSNTTGLVDTWRNSGSLPGADATGTAAGRPTYNASGPNQFNFNPSLTFDGTDDKLATANLPVIIGKKNGNDVGTQFVVIRRRDTNPHTTIYRYGSSGTTHKILAGTDGKMLQQEQFGTYATNSNEVALLDLSASNSSTASTLKIQKNARIYSGVYTGTWTDRGDNHPLVFGESENVFTPMDIAEVIVYPSVLTDDERIIVQSYLALKYGINLGRNSPVSQGSVEAISYKNSTGAVIWPSNSPYKFDVFGIGQDDGTGLNQPTSNCMNTGNGDGTGRSGKGNIVLSNPSDLDNGDYLIMGHDEGALTEISTELPANLSQARRMAREWRVQHTNDVGTVTLSFDVTGLTIAGTAADQFKLLVDTNNDFTSGATVIAASSFSGNKVTFTGVTLPNNSYVTFVTNIVRVGPGVSGAILWLKANEGATNSGGNLTGWTDQSGNNTFTKTGTIGYATDAINFNPAVSFNNPQLVTQLPSNRLEGNTSITYSDGFAVFRKKDINSGALIGGSVAGPAYGVAIFTGTNSANGRDIWMTDGTGAAGNFSRFMNNLLIPPNVALVGYDISGGSRTKAKATLNGEAQTMFFGSAAGLPDNPSATFIPWIGGTNNSGASVIPRDLFPHFIGDVSEIVLYPSGLSDPDKQKVQSYLAIKYGISLGNNTTEVAYTNSAGTTIWPANATYKYDIFGIGKDDDSGLNQASSNPINTGSGNGSGQSGKANLVLKNPSELANNDFLLIGHDNGPLAEQTTEVPAQFGAAKRIGREWKVQRTNDVGTVDLTFDLTGLTLTGTTANDFALMIDTDGNGNFADGTITSIKPASLTANVLLFDDITLPQNAVFSLITGLPNQPAWTLTMVAEASFFTAAGDQINYNIALRNTGNTTISAVSVADPTADTPPALQSGDANTNAILDIGETWVYTAVHTITAAEVTAQLYTNQVTASGTPALGNLNPVTDTETIKLSLTQSLIPKGPGGVMSSRLWFSNVYRVETSGGFVDALVNLGSEQFIKATGTGTARPRYILSGPETFNFNPVFSFDGTDDKLITPPITGLLLENPTSEATTQFVVYRKKNTNKRAVYQMSAGSPATAPWRLGVNTEGEFFQQNSKAFKQEGLQVGEVALLAGYAITSPTNTTIRFEKNGSDLNVNVVKNYQDSPDNRPFVIGEFNNEFADMEVAEILVFPGVLPFADQDKVQTNLALKYGISLGNNEKQLRYVAANGTVIWEADNLYYHDIFGIGYEVASGLNQRSSNSMNTGSGDGTGKAGKGNIVLKNPSSLDDNDYLIVGHNNTALSERDTDLPDNLAGRQRIIREWKVRHTGDVGTVTLTFDFNGLTSVTGPVSSQFILLVDTDGNGNFRDGNQLAYKATSLNGQVLTFDLVTLPDNAVFTFVTGLTYQPGGVLGASLWYNSGSDVIANGGKVESWNNLGYLANGEAKGTLNERPQLISAGSTQINFNPVISFDGAANKLVAGNVGDMLGNDAGNEAGTQFAVYRRRNSNNASIYQYSDNASGTPVRLGLGLDGSLKQQGTSGIASATSLDEVVLVDMTAITSSGTRTLNFNKNGAAGSPTYNTANYTNVPLTGKLFLGTDNLGFAQADLAEFVVYPKILSATERKKVQSYFAIKYGISLGNNNEAVDYLASDGTTIIWAADNTYKFDIFGIGNDAGSNLNQRSSGSINSGRGDGTGISGKGHTVLRITSRLSSGNYMLIGHNNAALTEQSAGLPPFLPGTRLARQWKVRNTGVTGEVDLSIDISGLTLTGSVRSEFKLLIDTDGDGNFTTGTPRVHSADGLTSGTTRVLTFTLAADSELPNNAVFTLVTSIAIEPAGVAGSNLWLKSDKDLTGTTSVTQWLDQTYTNTFTVVGTPTIKSGALNGKPTIVFANTGEPSSVPASSLNSNKSINFVSGYAVYKYNTPANAGALIGSDASGQPLGKAIFTGDGTLKVLAADGRLAGFAGYANADADTRFTLNYLDISLSQKPYALGKKDGVSQTVTAGAAGDFSALALKPIIGGTINSDDRGYYPFNGEVAEIILFSRALTPADEQKISSHLALKYGITLGTPAAPVKYVLSNGTEVWPGKSAYQNNIAGIGRDDGGLLRIESSASVNTSNGNLTGISGKGNLKISNATSLDNNDFLMIGSDTGALTEQSTDLPAAFAGAKRLGREWKVKRSGDVGNVDIQIDLNGLTVGSAFAAQFKLLIDTDGDFTNGTVDAIAASTFTGNVVSFNGINLPDESVFTILTSPAGAAVAGSNLWLRADAGVTQNAGNVTNWVDQTGINTFTVTGTPAYQNNAINFNPVVSFNNTEAATSLPSTRIEGNTNIVYVDGFAVFRKTDVESGTLVGSSTPRTAYGAAIFAGYSGNDIWMTDGTGDGGVYSSFNNTGVLPPNVALVGYDISGGLRTNAAGTLNGLSQSMIAGLPNGNTNYTSATFIPWIGGTNNVGTGLANYGFKHFRGEVAEIVLYPTSLSATDKLKIESQLAIKYGITLDPTVGNYVTSAGTVVWNNTFYWHDVFGIGKDDGGKLNQTSSNSMNTGSGDGTGQSGKANMVLTNATSLEEGDFIILGHDNGALTQQTTDVPTGVAVKRLGREWKVKHTGDAGNVDLKLDISGLGLTAAINEYSLMMDADGDGDFTTGAPYGIAPSSLIGTVLTFAGITLPNDAVFTLTVGSSVNPGGIAGHNLWYKAGSTSTANNFTWINQGSLLGSANAIASDAAQVPVKNTSGVKQINQNPTISFDGNDDLLASPPIAKLLGASGDDRLSTQLIVYRKSSATGSLYNYSDGAGGSFGIGAIGSDELYQNNFSRTGPLTNAGEVNMLSGVGTINATTQNFNAYQNGSATGFAATAGGPFDDMVNQPFFIGAAGDNNLHSNADIAEIIHFPAALNDADLNKVQSYLALKYGISLGNNTDAVNYTSANNAVVWTANATFKYDIFGIGKDDQSGLNQASSSSANSSEGDGTPIAGAGNVAVNSPSSLEDGDFLVIGNDNGTFEIINAGLANTDIFRVKRNWKVKRTGDVGTVTLRFDRTNIGDANITALSDNYLLIDNDGDGNFTTGTITQVNPTSFTAGVMEFTGLTLPEGAVVTFGYFSLDDWMVSAISTTKKFVAAGTTINYTFTLLNSGNLAITSPGIAVPNLTTGPTLTGGDTNNNNVLDPNETWSYSGTYLSTQADIDAGKVLRIVTPSGTPVSGTLPAISALVEVKAVQSPSMAITKAFNGSNVYDAVGDILNYSITVQNTGNITINALTVTDPDATTPVFISGDTGSDNVFGIGETWTYTASSTMTQNDLDAGFFKNTAEASGTPTGGTLATVHSTVKAVALQASGWTVDLSSATPDFDAANDVINYSVSLANVGNVRITNVALTLANVSGPSLTSGDANSNNILDVGETWIYNATYSVTQQDLDAGSVNRTVSVSGTPSGGVLIPVSDSHTVNAIQNSSWTLEKLTFPSTYSQVSDTLSYEYTLTNKGNTTIVVTGLTDSPLTEGPYLVNGDVNMNNKLDVGEVWIYQASYMIAQTDLDAGSVNSTATASGTITVGSLTNVTANALATADFDPRMELDARITTASYSKAGEQVDYELYLSNTGNVSISNVAMAAPQVSNDPTYVSGDTDNDTKLDVGERWYYTAYYLVKQGDLDRGSFASTASATGTSSNGVKLEANDTETISAIQKPGMKMTYLTQTSTFDAVNDLLDYTVTVTNTGNVSIGSVNLTGNLLSTFNLLSGDTDLNQILDVGEKWVFDAGYSVKQEDIDVGEVVSNVSAAGVMVSGQTVTTKDSELINAIQTAGWSVTKTVQPQTYTLPGNTITYQLEFSNTGNVSISNIQIIESRVTTNMTLVSGDTNLDGKLTPGEKWIYTATYTITLSDVVSGSVSSDSKISGKPAGGKLPDLTASATATRTALPAWTITRSYEATEYNNIGDELKVRIEITNTGNIAIRSITLTDSNLTTGPTLANGDTGSDNVLSLGEKWTYKGTYVVKQQDLIEGIISGTATANGSPDAGAITSVTATSTVSASWSSNPQVEEVNPTEGFSPNGDGVNDFWWIKNIEGFPNNTVYIYNSAGSLVFKSDGYNNSDNRFEGYANQNTIGSSNLNPGTYYYVIAIEGREKLTGYFTLLK